MLKSLENIKITIFLLCNKASKILPYCLAKHIARNYIHIYTIPLCKIICIARHKKYTINQAINISNSVKTITEPYPIYISNKAVRYISDFKLNSVYNNECIILSHDLKNVYKAEKCSITSKFKAFIVSEPHKFLTDFIYYWLYILIRSEHNYKTISDILVPVISVSEQMHLVQNVLLFKNKKKQLKALYRQSFNSYRLYKTIGLYNQLKK